MTIAYWCVLAAAVFPYAFTIFAKSAGRYNNHAPRDYLAKLEGVHKRANWVQMNSFEAFPPFAAAVIIAHLAQANQNTVDMLAVAFLVCRTLYGIAYLADQAALRSVIWFAGLGCVVGLFVSAA